jgi:hypothetical protein
MDLAECVIDGFTPVGSGRREVWTERFGEIIDQGLAGQWINATKAWGLNGKNAGAVRNAGKRCELTVEAHCVRGDLIIRVK